MLSVMSYPPSVDCTCPVHNSVCISGGTRPSPPPSFHPLPKKCGQLLSHPRLPVLFSQSMSFVLVMYFPAYSFLDIVLVFLRKVNLFSDVRAILFCLRPPFAREPVETILLLASRQL